MLPLLLRDLFSGSSSSPPEATTAAGAALGGGGGSRAGGPPGSVSQADAAAGVGAGVTLMAESKPSVGFKGAIAVVEVADASAPSNTEASRPSTALG
jgi:hypothetical protein